MNLAAASRALFAFALAVALCGVAPVRAQDEDSGEPVGEPLPGKALSDRDFGVLTRQFGLDRRVEMYQWQRSTGPVSSELGYQRIWNSAPIDSSGFAPGHANPARMPLENKRWWSESAILDGKPIDSSVLRALGEWKLFRPNFSRLPANLAATFQPEGDGLGSSENPLAPQIGDLRVTWRELRLPPLEGRLELREGHWRARPEAIAEALRAAPARVRPPPADPVDAAEHGGWSPGWFAVAVVLALIVLYRLRKRRQRLRQ
ncbi:TMEM43 family protein [Lysobacter sp. CA199]|uniref:TMEM43 family protein n=1 Tax=Lysobacter sp. CA199 TaxID=3455608 RepID=UPI003F8D510E